MNKITQLKRKQAQLEKLQKEVQSLEKSRDVQRELAFAREIQRVLDKYGKTVDDVARLPGVAGPAPKKRVRKQRKLKVYVNPHTKEKVETRGGNHNVLKAWKKEHGADVVEGWLK